MIKMINLITKKKSKIQSQLVVVAPLPGTGMPEDMLNLEVVEAEEILKVDLDRFIRRKKRELMMPKLRITLK